MSTRPAVVRSRRRLRRWATAATMLAAVALAACDRDASPPAPTPAARPALPPAGSTVRAAAAPPAPVPDSIREEVARLVMSGQLADAQLRIDALGDDGARDGRVVFLEGMIHHRQKRYAEARQRFERALELAPDHVIVHHFLGYGAFYLGDLDAARTAFEAHLAAVPDEPDSHFGLGLVALEQGRLDDAESELGAAVTLTEALREKDPRRYAMRRIDLAKAHARLADVHIARGDFAAARRELLASLDFHREHASVFYTLATVERRLGNEEAAAEALARFERLEAVRAGGVAEDSEP